jgi:SAM-dependent methyltransferase
MKPRMLDVLNCPCCGGDGLQVDAFDSDNIVLTAEQIDLCSQLNIEPSKVSTTIKTGLLLCGHCKTWFPLRNHVPVLWKFKTRFHREFEREFRGRSEKFKTHKPPSGEARRGEKQTLINYTTTWKTTGENELNFYFTHDKIQDIFKACLDWPDWALKRENMRILDVGVGFGYEAANVHAVFKTAETFGIDLNVSAVTGGHLFSNEPFLHFAVCSLFDIPFPKEYFDAVISMGVLHHTYSTREAFRSVTQHMKDDGFVLIWLYGQEDFAGTPQDMLRYIWREWLVRPVIARLPQIFQVPIIHLISIFRYFPEKRRVPNKDKWKYRNTVHHTRDLFTPVYAYRHRFFEPIMWMDELDMHCEHLNYVLFKNRIGYWNNGVTCRGVRRKSMALVESSVDRNGK